MQHTELNSAAQTVQKSTRLRRNRFIFTSLLIMGIMSWFCAMTPWVSDDYAFSSIYPGCTSLWDMQVLEYREWSGKFVGHFMSRVLLRGPAWLHPLLTPAMFLLLVASGSLLAVGAQWRERLSAWHLAVMAGLVWIALPAFGTVFFWRTGTGDYGYSLVWGVLFLVPYRIWADKADFRMPGGLLYALVGILAGWSNENVGMLVLLAALGVTLFRWRASRNVPAWALSGIAGAAFGWGMMMAAPGNAVRLAAVGGAGKIPLLSLPAFLRFLEFWSTQQLEMLPYFLASLALAWLLRRRGLLKPAVWIPSVIFFLMAQASLAAFIASPSTPYRAMSATFFFTALCPFSLLAALNPSSIKAKALFVIFCALLLSSVLIEARVFLMAQPVIATHNNSTLRSLDYPETDKYFFPGYDIREVSLFSTDWRNLVPWNESRTLRVFEAPDARTLVACNIAFFDNLPQGKVHVAARIRTATTASLLQQAARALFESPDEGIVSARTAALRYFPASATVTDDGKAALFIPGIKSVDDIAYIAVEQLGAPLVWRRASAPHLQN
ncbi:DUF6056 family protein [Desulfovibrio sp.]|uniref:DUF6056 family protein n=1 Tax=Desulfovibrio sp. TaxID=885 RepID=UPI002D79CD49|nr:DUF6056 family protein [Desulfovibrio sp.]